MVSQRGSPLRLTESGAPSRSRTTSEQVASKPIAAMEDGLNAYDGALLVVSHDADFLEAIGITRTLTLAGQDDPRP